MPNHFHLLIYQYDKDAISELMRSVATGYSIYFNKRHKRVGPLFQGRYKASLIDSDTYWTYISAYIHLNPVDLGVGYETYNYSSYKVFLDKQKINWCKPDLIKKGFKTTKDYKNFVKECKNNKAEYKVAKNHLANT